MVGSWLSLQKSFQVSLDRQPLHPSEESPCLRAGRSQSKYLCHLELCATLLLRKHWSAGINRPQLESHSEWCKVPLASSAPFVALQVAIALDATNAFPYLPELAAAQGARAARALAFDRGVWRESNKKNK